MVEVKSMSSFHQLDLQVPPFHLDCLCLQFPRMLGTPCPSLVQRNHTAAKVLLEVSDSPLLGRIQKPSSVVGRARKPALRS